MRIAFDAKRAYHNCRGLGNYSRDYIRLLSQYEPDGEYFLFNPRHPSAVRMPDYESCREVLPTPLWRHFPALWRSYGCLSQVRNLQVEWYHGLSGELPFGIHRLPVRTVVTVHDAIFERYPELYSPTYRLLFRRKCRYACKVADVVVAVSEQTKRDCVRFFGADERKIKVVYQGCDARFRQKVSEQEKDRVRQKYALPDVFLLDVGAVEPRKNLSNLLSALQLSALDIPLVVVGGRSRYAELMKRKAARLHLPVLFLQDVNFADLPAVCQMAHGSVYPSLFEGFGIPILEALCSGVPVLTSTGSCFRETGGEAALYADPENPAQMAEQLRCLVLDNQMRSRLKEEAVRQAARFDDEHVAQNILSVYE